MCLGLGGAAGARMGKVSKVRTKAFEGADSVAPGIAAEVTNVHGPTWMNPLPNKSQVPTLMAKQHLMGSSCLDITLGLNGMLGATRMFRNECH